jgi:hypothetical protein
MSDNKTREEESSLFKRLTKLFSGPIVDRRREAVFRGKSSNIKKYTFTTNTGKSFKKQEHYNPFEGIQAKMLQGQRRNQRYTDFDQMEFTPELASGLDIYADEITTSTPINPILQVKCSNEELKSTINTLFYNVLNIEFNLFGWARSMCKYGDYFLYLDIDDEEGITNAISLPVREVERLEGKDPTNPNYIQYFWTSGQEAVTFENWQIAHFRVLGNDMYAPYGTSVLESARRIWRQVTLVEDAMMAYRVVRSPERRVFYIDVGNISPSDVEQYMEQVKTSMKRNQVIDADTGRVDLRYNPMSIDEDFYIPVRGGVSSRIETLAGGAITGDIEDVEYLRDKMFSAIKIPKAYLAQSESMEDKTTLAQKDIRFARTVQRLQRIIVAELEKMAIIHLYTLGYRGEDLLSFSLSLNNPSKIAELQELEHLNTKFDIAGAATDGMFSKRWVYKNIFSMDDNEIERILQEQYNDSKHQAAIEAAGSAVESGGGTGADLGEEGFDDIDDAGMDDEATDDTDIPDGEDETLLAAPGKRDAIRLTPGAKGHSYVSKSGPGHRRDGGDRRSAGARNRSNTAKTGSGKTDTNPGYAGELSALASGFISAGISRDEELIFETTKTVTDLINELETRNENKTQ